MSWLRVDRPWLAALEPSGTSLALATEYKVRALTTWRGPSAAKSRIAPARVSYGLSPMRTILDLPLRWK